MPTFPLSRRALLAGAAAAVVTGICPLDLTPAEAVEAKPTTKPTTSPARDAAIRKLEEFYAKTYGEPLASTERLPREIAIVSLSRIDAPPITERLFDVFSAKGKVKADPIVQYLAWEALHARHASLSAEQRRRWVTAGLKAANAGAFPEATAAPLLLALAEFEPTALEAEPTGLALRVVRESDLEEPTGKAALDALRHLVAAWHDPRMVRALVKELNKSKTPAVPARVNHVLRGLPDAPPEGADPKKAWNGASGAVAKLKVATKDELKPYAGKSAAFPPAERITDPNDRRWRAELEIAKLAVSDFDLAWCIDSTGSMNDENQLVAQETGVVLRVFALVSKRARCGTIYMRHETDAALMDACCERAKANPAWYQVKGYPLTTDAAGLSATMAAERIPVPDPMREGNVHPGTAFHGALTAAMERMPWSKDPTARRAIVLVGDSRVTAGSEDACTKLVATAKQRGFQVHALVKGGAMRTWEPFIDAGGGETFAFRTSDEMPDLPADAPFRARRRMMMEARAEEMDPQTVFGEVAATVIRGSVTPAYHDRVDPLVKVLLAYARAAARAERNAGTTGGDAKRNKW